MGTNGSNYAPHCPKLPWMVDFYSTGNGRVAKYQQAAVYADTYQEYAARLTIDSALYPKRLTGIVCTIGPRTNDLETLEKLIEEGMTIARIKSISYTRREDCREVVATIRRACDEHSKKIGRVYALAIALDIQGPEIRTGDLSTKSGDEIELVQGNAVSITSDTAYEEHVTEDMIYVDYQHIEQVVAPGDHVHLNDGEVTLSAREIVGSVIKCIIEKTGKLISKASVSVEGVPVHRPTPISERDSKDIQFCVTEQLDLVFLSYVKDAAMVRQARRILGEEGKSIMIVAKVENGQGFANVDEIIAEADAILINRAKLAMELPQEKLFIVQKSIIAKCNHAGKPVICAPRMLESMGASSRPTRAELMDVSQAVLEGADCLLLSRETEHGDYAVESVRTLATLCREAEAAVPHHRERGPRTSSLWPVEPIYGIAAAIAEAAMRCQAAAVVMTTTTGRAAQVVARSRPRCPIVAVTRFGTVARQLRLWRAIEPLHYIRPADPDWLKDVERRIQYGITYGKMSGFIAPGDCIIAARTARPGTGFVNTMHIYYASEFDVVSPTSPPTSSPEQHDRATRP